MKRTILAALSAGLVALAGAAARPLSRPTTAANRRLAQVDAQRLLRRVVLPPGAQELTAAPAGGQGALEHPVQAPGSPALVDVHRIWQVQEPVAATMSWVRAHPPHGSRVQGEGSGAVSRFLTYALRPLAGRVRLRWIELSFVPLPDGSTGVRSDAQDVWVVVRRAGEVLPAAVRRVDVEIGYPKQQPKVSLHVTSRGEVRRIVRWLDGLPVVQPEGFHCIALIAAARATFSFRAADGSLLARASMPDYGGAAGGCDPIELGIGGRPQKPLAGDFLGRVQKLLGVRLILPPPTAG